MCQNTTMWVYGHGLNTFRFMLKNIAYIVAKAGCYNSALVRDKPLWTPASVKRVYYNPVCFT